MLHSRNTIRERKLSRNPITRRTLLQKFAILSVNWIWIFCCIGQLYALERDVQQLIFAYISRLGAHYIHLLFNFRLTFRFIAPISQVIQADRNDIAIDGNDY